VRAQPNTAAAQAPATGKNGAVPNWRTNTPVRATDSGKLPNEQSMIRLITRPSSPAGAHACSRGSSIALPSPMPTPIAPTAAIAPGSPPANGITDMLAVAARNATVAPTVGARIRPLRVPISEPISVPAASIASTAP
jgi:hypothetical protein